MDVSLFIYILYLIIYLFEPMQFLIILINIILILGYLICPIFLAKMIIRYNFKYKFLLYIFLSFILTSIIIFIFSWWLYFSDTLLLSYYGYNINGINEREFYFNVQPQNLDIVKDIETRIMGIGWTLKSIILILILSPYLFVIYGLRFIFFKDLKK